ncbi:MAG: hypothetical protein EYC70_12565 [Planctomycetota bacterium]|nr:MAG: hypothetical protein EYC70_12565 [Planctomycetota bacterium]
MLLLLVPLLFQDPGVPEAFRAWQLQHGDSWVLRVRPGTGAGRFLYGGRARAPFACASDADYAELARVVLQEASGVLRLDESTLVLQELHRLALSRIGSSDKVALVFTQEVRGVPVVGASVTVLCAPGGDLLALDSTALPQVQSLLTLPAVDPRAAIAAAHSAYAALEGRAAGTIGVPELVIYPHQPGERIVPRLAWAVELRTPVADGIPSGRRMYVAADALADVLGSDQLVHTCGRAGTNDLTGHVDSFATPGVLPDTAANPETLQAMRSLRVSSTAGSAVTDAAGNFTIPHTGTTPVTLSFAFTGPFALVNNAAGLDYSLSVPFTPGVFQSVTMNPALTEEVTAQANAFNGIHDFRDYLKSIDPGENTMDFQVLANVNIASTCNAFFDGFSINFYLAGGGCPNTAYSTLVAHEEGHWANVREGSGNGPDGFGEGNADAYAMYIYDTPVVGQDFYGPGTLIRTGENMRQFCGDNNPGCYGETHSDGQVLMGALWKVRRNLNSSFGDAAGDLIADTLFVSWMNAYNDGQIRSIIEDHWLSLDDDDGNLANGTPSFPEIDSGFREQGFPGVDLNLIRITHTPLADTPNEFGPYVVSAQIEALAGNVITAAEVVYRVDGGDYQVLPMAHLGADQWAAGIPGQASVARVDYHVTARDDHGYRQNLPRSSDFSFLVGVVLPVYAEDFEGPGDAGWTHGRSQGSDDWQRGVPQGKSSDPAAAFSGLACWGNDLGNGTDGKYANNSANFLDSPAIDCSAFSGVTLRFRRWLSVEAGTADQARISVLAGGVWNPVWSNDLGVNSADFGWVEHEVDLSAFADGNPAMQLRFEMTSNFFVNFGGWNVDDLRLVSIRPTGDTDVLLLSGPSAAAVGQRVTYELSAAPPSAPCWVYASRSAAGSVINGHAFDIGAPRFTAATGTTSATGSISWTSPPLPARGAGLTVYLEARADQGLETFDSNLLSLSIQ